MFIETREINAISLSLSSEIPVIENAIDAVEYFISRFDIADCTNLALVLRELLRNAIIHGNKNRPGRIVTCNIKKLDNGRFEIKVKDEGSGFNYKYLDMSLPEDPRNLKKRGYVLINELSEKIIFNSNGSQITAYISLPCRGFNE